jgi:hypothetical protein
MTKPEIRIDDEIRMTNEARRSRFVIRHSDLIRISGFVIRISGR